MRFDYHVHESHSGDAKESTIEDYVKRAEEIGVEEIAFTTHLLLSTPDTHISVKVDEIGDYLEDIEHAQRDTRVKLLKSLEVDYIPSDEKRIERILDEHHLDFVLGSVHYVNGVDIGSRRKAPAFFQGRDLKEAVDEYYEVWRRAIETGIFDVMAHPDYWRKYVPKTHPRPLRWEDYGSTVIDALDSLHNYGVGLEVNTSGHKHGLGANFPLDCFLSAANSSGVRKWTVGSDSHKVEELGGYFEDAVSQLKRVGITEVTKYRDGKSSNIKLT